MEWLMTLWCGLIGITDPMTIHVATGIAAAAAPLFAVYCIIVSILSLFISGLR